MRSFSIPLPDRMKKLPVDSRGFPVPYFVTWFDDNGKVVANGRGYPDFRIIDPSKMALCHNNSLCWICGDKMGTYKSFVIGPMCAVNRTISEPPSHHECADFAARCCPFLSNPRMKRDKKDLPDDYVSPPGMALERNPAVACVWTTKTYKLFKVDSGNGSREGVLFRIGEPVEVEWWAQGHEATLDEVAASISSGFSHLYEVAEQEGMEALRDLGRYMQRLIPLLPGASP